MAEKLYQVQDIEKIPSSQLLATVRNLKEEGYRLGQACATAKEDGFELLYSFDKDYVLKNLKIVIGMEEKVESVTGEYWPAFIYENEMHDLFGIKFLHNELDYNGNFYKVPQEAPWKK